jgi:hypothetical protein
VTSLPTRWVGRGVGSLQTLLTSARNDVRRAMLEKLDKMHSLVGNAQQPSVHMGFTRNRRNCTLKPLK